MGCVEETWCQPWGMWRRLGAVGCVETWCHGVCGGDLVPWGVWRRPGAMGCVEETWCHGVCGGDLVPWGVGRRPAAMGCVEETCCHGVCGGDLLPWGVWRRPGAMGCVETGARGCVAETWCHGVCIPLVGGRCPPPVPLATLAPPPSPQVHLWTSSCMPLWMRGPSWVGQHLQTTSCHVFSKVKLLEWRHPRARIGSMLL